MTRRRVFTKMSPAICLRIFPTVALPIHPDKTPDALQSALQMR